MVCVWYCWCCHPCFRRLVNFLSIFLVLITTKTDGVLGSSSLSQLPLEKSGNLRSERRTQYSNSNAGRTVRITLLINTGTNNKVASNIITNSSIEDDSNADNTTLIDGDGDSDAVNAADTGDEDESDNPFLADLAKINEYGANNNDEGRLTNANSNNYINGTFYGQVARFGSPFSSNEFYTANLMLPPVNIYDSHLCEYPKIVSSTVSSTNTTTMHDKSSSSNKKKRKIPEIALLISSGLCSPEQKARVALRLQSEFSNLYHIKYLIIHSNDYSYPNEVITLQPDEHDNKEEKHYPSYNDNNDNNPKDNNNTTENDSNNKKGTYDDDNNNNNNLEDRYPEELDVFKILSVSALDGLEIHLLMNNVSLATRASPYFLSEGNEHWDLPIIIEREDFYYHDTYSSSAGGVAYGNYHPTERNTNKNNPSEFDGNNNDNMNRYGTNLDDDEVEQSRRAISEFYWFRFVLFSLLIISPCLRAAYLWYVSGGRIRFMYNERGRVIGIRYIPPVPHWFSTRDPEADHHHVNPAVQCLTEAQVMALPQIAYQPDPTTLNGGGVNNSFSSPENKTTPPDENPLAVEEELQDVQVIASCANNEQNNEEEGGVDQLSKHEPPQQKESQEQQVLQAQLQHPELQQSQQLSNSQLSQHSQQSQQSQSHGTQQQRWRRRLRRIRHRIYPRQQSQESSEQSDQPTVDLAASTSGIAMMPLSTTCGTCSICIDDFEPGEKIRILPHCRHAFHTECILPWLTERQGACPLCKVSVLEQQQPTQQSLPSSPQEVSHGSDVDNDTRIATTTTTTTTPSSPQPDPSS